MTTDDDLRARFAAASAPAALDPAAIIAGARRRRRPRVIAAGTVGALATVGVLVLGIQFALPSTDSGSIASLESAPAADAPVGGASDSALMDRAAASAMNFCGAGVVEAVPNTLGLTLEPVFPASVPAGATVEGVVRLTNTGAERFTGSAAPTATVSVAENGLVVWHTNGPAILSLAIIDLAPGESMDLPASVTAVRCGPENETGAAFPGDLPALAPGDYTVSALLDVTPDGRPVELVASDPVALSVD